VGHHRPTIVGITICWTSAIVVDGLPSTQQIFSYLDRKERPPVLEHKIFKEQYIRIGITQSTRVRVSVDKDLELNIGVIGKL